MNRYHQNAARAREEQQRKADERQQKTESNNYRARNAAAEPVRNEPIKREKNITGKGSIERGKAYSTDYKTGFLEWDHKRPDATLRNMRTKYKALLSSGAIEPPKKKKK